jgi:hypothetical protein
VAYSIRSKIQRCTAVRGRRRASGAAPDAAGETTELDWLSNSRSAILIVARESAARSSSDLPIQDAHGARLPEDNVVKFRPRADSDDPPSELINMLRSVINALDELAGGFERIKLGLHWSPGRWSARSMSFRMQRVPAEQQLRELHDIDPADWADTSWASQLSSARFAFEQQLDSISSLLDMLLHADMPPDERAWHMERFAAEGKGFVEAYQQLRNVIVARYPQVRRLP